MLKEKTKKFLNLLNNSPLNFANENSNFEIIGNKEVKIEGFRKILDFSDNNIKILAKNMYVNFSGRNLNIKCLTQDSLLIIGFINNIEFYT